MTRPRIWVLAALLAGLCLWNHESFAQKDPGGAGAESGQGESAATPRQQLPNYFGKLGVSDEQREKLLKIDADYEARIEALRDQIRELVKQRDSAMEQELSPGQQLRLKELRAEARKRGAQPDNADAANDADQTDPAPEPKAE
ncbi:MAG: hypothetical protein R3B90_01935 [Planctomycetaceae bacterium]